MNTSTGARNHEEREEHLSLTATAASSPLFLSTSTMVGLPDLLLQLTGKTSPHVTGMEDEKQSFLGSPSPAVLPLLTLCFDLNEFGDFSIQSSSSPSLPVGEDKQSDRTGRLPSCQGAPPLVEAMPPATVGNMASSSPPVQRSPSSFSDFHPLEFVRQKTQEGASLETLSQDLGTWCATLQTAIHMEVEQSVPSAVISAARAKCRAFRQEVQTSLPEELGELMRTLEERCERMKMTLVEVKEKMDAATLARTEQSFLDAFLRVMLLYDSLALLNVPSPLSDEMDVEEEEEVRRMGSDTVRSDVGGGRQEEKGTDEKERERNHSPLKGKKRDWFKRKEEEVSYPLSSPFYTFESEEPMRTPYPFHMNPMDERSGTNRGYYQASTSERESGGSSGGTTARTTTSGVEGASAARYWIHRSLFSRVRTLQRAVGILCALYEVGGKDWTFFRRKQDPKAKKLEMQMDEMKKKKRSSFQASEGEYTCHPSMASGANTNATANAGDEDRNNVNPEDPLSALLEMNPCYAKEAEEALGWCQDAERAVLNEMQSVIAEVGRLYFYHSEEALHHYENEKREEQEENIDDQKKKKGSEPQRKGIATASTTTLGGEEEVLASLCSPGTITKSEDRTCPSSQEGARCSSLSSFEESSSSSSAFLSQSIFLMREVVRLYATLGALEEFIEVCQKTVVLPFLQRVVSWTAATHSLHHAESSISLLHRLGEVLHYHMKPLLTVWGSAFTPPTWNATMECSSTERSDHLLEEWHDRMLGKEGPTVSAGAIGGDTTASTSSTPRKTGNINTEEEPHPVFPPASSVRLFPVADIVWPAVCAVLQEKLSRSLFDVTHLETFRRKYVAAAALKQKILDLCSFSPEFSTPSETKEERLQETEKPSSLTLSWDKRGLEERERFRRAVATREWSQKWRVDVYATQCAMHMAKQVSKEIKRCEEVVETALAASQEMAVAFQNTPRGVNNLHTKTGSGSSGTALHQATPSFASLVFSASGRKGACDSVQGGVGSLPALPVGNAGEDDRGGHGLLTDPFGIASSAGVEAPGQSSFGKQPTGSGTALPSSSLSSSPATLSSYWCVAIHALDSLWNTLCSSFLQLFTTQFLPSAAPVFLRQCITSCKAVAVFLHHSIAEKIMTTLHTPSFSSLPWKLAHVPSDSSQDKILGPSSTGSTTTTTSHPTRDTANTMNREHKNRDAPFLDFSSAEHNSPRDILHRCLPEESSNVLLLFILFLFSVFHHVISISHFLSIEGKACRLVRATVSPMEPEDDAGSSERSTSSSSFHSLSFRTTLQRQDPPNGSKGEEGGATGRAVSISECKTTHLNGKKSGGAEGDTTILQASHTLCTWCSTDILQKHYFPMVHQFTYSVMIPACVHPLQHIRSVRSFFAHTQREAPSSPSWYVPSVWQPVGVLCRCWELYQEVFRATMAPPLWKEATFSLDSSSSTSFDSLLSMKETMTALTREWIHVSYHIRLAVVQRFAELATETLEAARKTEEGWEKLRRKREATAAGRAEVGDEKNTAMGPSGNSISCSSSPSPGTLTLKSPAPTSSSFSDRDKMTMQLYLDAMEICRQFTLFTSSFSTVSTLSASWEMRAPDGYARLEQEVYQKEEELWRLLRQGKDFLDGKGRGM